MFILIYERHNLTIFILKYDDIPVWRHKEMTTYGRISKTHTGRESEKKGVKNRTTRILFDFMSRQMVLFAF